jgi:tape measure domain-containing protein
MKDLGRGPADKMAAALKGGDWEQARSELKKLQQQVAAGQLSAAAKKQLAEQLKRLEQQLADAAARREQAMDELKKQIEQQKQKGDLAKAGELQQKLEKLAKQKKQGKQLEQLAQQLAEASENMQKGDQKAASESMSEMMQQLDQMQQEMDADAAESAMLDMAMDELEMSKDSLVCENCQGEGCSECQGDMPGDSMNGQSGGRGIGSGRAFGARPQDDLNTAFRDTQVKQNPGRGPAVITGEADGPTIRGDVREAVKEEVAAAESDEADAMVIEQLPRSQRENAEEYFNRLREGE